MRVMALDLGDRRIGIAVCDPRGTIATPSSVVERASSRTGGRRADHRAIATLVDELEAAKVIVGLPLSLDGTVGPAAQRVLDEIDLLRDCLDVPIEFYDERLTTVEAERSLREMSVKGQAKRKVIDQVAAAVILQAWLDAGMPTSSGEDPK